MQHLGETPSNNKRRGSVAEFVIGVAIVVVLALVAIYPPPKIAVTDTGLTTATQAIAAKDARIAELEAKLAERPIGKWLGRVIVSFQGYELAMEEYVPDGYGDNNRNWPAYACTAITGERGGQTKFRQVTLDGMFAPVRDVK